MNRYATMILASVSGAVSLSPTVSPAQQWLHCANQGEQCDVDGVAVMRYGVDQRWTYHVATDFRLCDGSQFGDPAPGTPKTCQRWEPPDETARNANLQAVQAQLQQAQQRINEYEGQENYIADLEEENAIMRRELRQQRRARRRD